jgi:hypothetical protein
VKHKVRLDNLMIDAKKIPHIDTIIALSKIDDQFNNEFVPAMVTILVYYNPFANNI